MNRAVLLVTLLAVAGCASTQTQIPASTTSGLMLRQPTIAEVEAFETANGSQHVPTPSYIQYSIAAELCPVAADHDLSLNIRFEKPAGDLPAAEVGYYATSDSTVYCVLYTWRPEEMPTLSSLGALFDRVTTELAPELGEPDRLDADFYDFRFDGGDTVYQRKDARWTLGKTVVTTRVLFSPQSNQRVRTVIYWVPEEDA